MPQSVTPLQDTWERLRVQIDQALEDSLKRLPAATPEQLREAMSYSLMAGGKRLRPLLVLLACDACGGEMEAALPAACAIEMVHTYSLIHDDLPAMDDDDLRRGRPTNHKVHGEALAILAGDALLTYAFEVIATQVQPPLVAAACCADLASAAGAEGMVGGQVADLQAEHAGIENLAHLESIHSKKTGRLLCSALTMGGRVAGADENSIEILRNYGNCVGLAFQIADDVLDVTGDVAKMGKGVNKDQNHGKLTYPALLGLEESREKARELIRRACTCLEPLGEKSQHLKALAEFIIKRDH